MNQKQLWIIFAVVATVICEESLNNSTKPESPRYVQDSYLAALANSRNSRKSTEKTNVVYVMAENQRAKIVPVKAPEITTKAPEITTKAPVAGPNPVRREDNNYITGPNAEPTAHSAYSSDIGTNYYDSYAGNGYDSPSVDSYLPPNNKYLPPPTPKPQELSPYTYGPPTPVYGPPKPVYGPPKPMYGVPYEAPSFFDKIAIKLDLVTLAKILLKVLIFKKIVKFIAIVCLLFFIPKLIHIKKGNNSDDEGRKFQHVSEAKMNDEMVILATFVQQALRVYSMQQRGCENITCRVKRVLDNVDRDYSLPSIQEVFHHN